MSGSAADNYQRVSGEENLLFPGGQTHLHSDESGTDKITGLMSEQWG